MAAVVAVLAATAVAAAPAGAQDVDVQLNMANPCTEPDLPGCVDWTFDMGHWAVDTGRNTYNNDVQPVLDDAACYVYEVGNPDDCPTRGMFDILG